VTRGGKGQSPGSLFTLNSRKKKIDEPPTYYLPLTGREGKEDGKGTRVPDGGRDVEMGVRG